jgi:glycosyltransferase involved in cell wall biosynthesis
MSPLSIVAVVVLYKIDPATCITIEGLNRAVIYAHDNDVTLTTLIVDNSPQPSTAPVESLLNIHYEAFPENLGLANAYNRGITLARRIGATWLLTLDQDTELPPHFLASMAAHARRIQDDPTTSAILPQIYAGEAPISPLYYRWTALPTWFAKGYTAIPQQAVSGINSASMLRVDSLEQAGGYAPLFWLDGSDMMIFDRLHHLGKRVFVAGDVQVQHGLSLKNLQQGASPNRYRHMLLAESAFWDMAMSPLAGMERTSRLAFRLLRQIRRGDSEALRSLTLHFFLLRLFRSARYRRARFLEAVQLELGDKLLHTALPKREPKVSVCIATYNAGKYIDAQLHSILQQLEQGDEVIVIDDVSTDGTPERIRSFGDPRVRVIQRETNAGATKAFEQALRSATGDILFLSDQDDIWSPNKVASFREAFAQSSDVQLVMSAVSLIDSEGVPFRNKRYDKDGKFQRGFFRNILKNDYQGSALAIRSDLLASLLPFPQNRAYLHDAWIGTVNDRLQNGMVFLPMPLLQYRRHAANVSQRMTIAEMAVSRTQLILDHWLHALRGRGRRTKHPLK